MLIPETRSRRSVSTADSARLRRIALRCCGVAGNTLMVLALVPTSACGGASRGDEGGPPQAAGAASGGSAGGVTGCAQGSGCTAAGSTSVGGAPSRLPCYGGCSDDPRTRPEPSARPVCPNAEPTSGADCSRTGLLCSYGDESDTACRRFYRCDGVWTVDEESTRVPCQKSPPNYCPTVSPHGGDCTVSAAGSGVPCRYEELACYCQTNLQSEPGALGRWNCYGPPANSQCPANLPHIGEGCATPGVECVFAPNGCIAQPYTSVYCHMGSWEPGTGLPCIGG
jgi:hypothetical protein